MSYRYYGKNIRPFTAICDCDFGRKVIYTNKRKITENNIVEELNKALTIHRQNAREIDYLERYYRGDQPILYRKKVNRPEVNNKVPINLAYLVVERKTAEMFAEPMQYVLRGTDDSKSEEVTQLNVIMETENKQECDIERKRWASMCGTSYMFVGKDETSGEVDALDESDFMLSTEDPRLTFVVYYSNGKPAFSCQIREDEDGKEFYFCYTNSEYFEIADGKIRNPLTNENGDRLNINGNKYIPVTEYPNNSRRLSDIEITMGISDAINVLTSDRVNGIEQFVSAWVKFVNCEIDKEKFEQMRLAGALVVKSNNGSDNKADVDVMSNELNQTEGQVVFNDLFEKFLSIQGLANRSNENSGGDTGSAVSLRNGHYDAELRTAINEPIWIKSERMTLKIILYKLKVKKKFTLMPSDIEIHVNHNKLDNMLVKAEVLKILLDAGVYYKRAIKTVDMFSDPELVASESATRMELLYPDTVPQQNTQQIREVVE